MEERGAGELRYRAFLSYSHKDSAAAARLHRRLETYRMPRRLVGSSTVRGTVPVPDRLWPIFRDRDELPAATDLSETVREALAQSGSLIVLCSPHAATSLWVAEEIETFQRLYPERPILAAIIEGDPPGCFPAALRAFGQDGTWHEPLATDLRREGDGPHLGLLKLVAGITGVRLDALVQRDAQRKIRRVTAVTAGALVAMLMMAALTLIALDARREAERQRAEAEGLVEFMLTDLREKLRSVGRLDVMTSVNQRALLYYGEQDRLSDLSPDSLERRSRVLHAMGEDDIRRGDLATALGALREAHRTTAEQLARAPLDPHRIFAHSQSEYWIGFVDFEQRNYAAARPSFERYKALADRLVAIDPANPQWLQELAFAEGNLCSVALSSPRDVSGALRTCAASLAHMRQAARASSDPEIKAHVANRHAWLADAWRAAGQLDRALSERRAQERIINRLVARDPDNRELRERWVLMQISFADLHRHRGEHRASRERLDQALAAVNEMVVFDRSDRTLATHRQYILRRLRELNQIN